MIYNAMSHALIGKTSCMIHSRILLASINVVEQAYIPKIISFIQYRTHCSPLVHKTSAVDWPISLLPAQYTAMRSQETD